jgi:voltage-gated potassium channel Kch
MRIKKHRLGPRRFSIRRSINTPDNGFGGPFLLICVIVGMSLPIWANGFAQFMQNNQFTEQFPFLRYEFIKTLPFMQQEEDRLRNAPYVGFALVLLYAVTLAINTIRALYKIRIKWADRLVRSVSLFSGRRNTVGEIVFSAIASYALSIYAFGLTYFYIHSSHFEPTPFVAPPNEGLFTWVYFSIVTMATVGYGEITPQTDWARTIVSAEILMGVAYQIFFFSIVASFVRERSRP